MDTASIFTLYKSSKFEECGQRLQILLNEITDLARNDKLCPLTEEFYSPLSLIMNEEAMLLAEDEHHNFQLSICVIQCVRNSFCHISHNQDIFATQQNLHMPIIRILTYFLEHKSSNLNKSFIEDICRASITCFVNMMAGNSSARRKVYNILKPYYSKMMFFSSLDLCHLGCAVLNNFLQDLEISQDILRNEGELMALIKQLLSLYTHEGPNACFALFCLKELICSSDVITQVWKDLPTRQKLVTLDVAISMLLKSEKKLPKLNIVLYFIDQFKRNADAILCTHDRLVNEGEIMVIPRLLTFCCCAASSEEFSLKIQEDKSLLISTLYLLKGITDIGNERENYFSRLSSTDSEASGDAAIHPAFTFKNELIRLVSTLVYRNSDNQNTVREEKGIELILENSQFDGRNPLIREECIFAIRNLLEGCDANQVYTSQFNVKGVAENSQLRALGMEPVLKDGKLQLKKLNSS